jgi:crotonobetainyl-CoA:carnitine CoA-transferase CaiB-like acyl-CoA transferase
LLARHFWQNSSRAYLGPQDLPSAPFRPQGGAPLPIRRAAPTLGQENDAVLSDSWAD